MLAQLRPQTHPTYSSLPVLGPIVDGFTDWAHRCGYAFRTIQMQLGNLRQLAQWFRCRGRGTWKELTADDFPSARKQLANRKESMGATIGQIQRFLQQVHGMALVPKPVTRVESELMRYTDYLGQVRGFALQTIAGNRSCVGAFLKFIGCERSRSAIATLGLPQIESFLRSQAIPLRGNH